MILVCLDCIAPGKGTSSDSSSEILSDKSGKLGTPKKRSQFGERRIINVMNLNKNAEGKIVSTTGETVSFTPNVPRRRQNNLYKVSLVNNSTKVRKGSDEPNSEDKDKGKDEHQKVDKVKSVSKMLINMTAKSQEKKLPLPIKEPEVEFDIARLVLAPNSNEQVLRKHTELIMKGLHYSVNLLKSPPLTYIQQKQISLRELKSKDKIDCINLQRKI